jgi:hypothetical protein
MIASSADGKKKEKTSQTLEQYAILESFRYAKDFR